MLKRALTLSLLTLSIHAADIHTLLQGVKHHYTARLGELGVQEAANALELVRSQLYPKIGLFGSVTHYNSPTNLRPTTPTETAAVAPDFPFSKNVERIGATVSMPIFVKSLYTLADKATFMQRSAQDKKRLDILKDEATVVGSNANLIYLQELERALRKKRSTLMTTRRIVEVKVRSGRAPRSALFKIQDQLDQIDIAINAIEIQKENILSILQTLTGVSLRHAVAMRHHGRLRRGDFLALKPLRAKTAADRLALRAEKEKLLPSFYLQGNFSRGYGKSYQSDRHIHRDYGSIGLNVKMPLFDMHQYRSIERARIHALRSGTQLAKTAEELRAKARALSRQLRLLEHSVRLNRRNIANQRKLLAIAKTSYDDGRMTLEEYLRYVDALFDARANLYKSKAQYWQTLAQLAFLYGNDLERIVR
ncbi:TolC family protein [Nitratifractor sp.]